MGEEKKSQINEAAEDIMPGDKDINGHRHTHHHDPDEKKRRHETVFPEECRKAFQMGVHLCVK